MPGFDGTGPAGMGPMTGGGRGFCSPWGVGAANRGYGYPYNRGAIPYYNYGGVPLAPQMTRQQELDSLRGQTDMLNSRLKQIEARLSELGTE